MTWKKLLAERRVTRLPASKAELDSLRSIVTRSSLMVVRAAGYRPRSIGAHYNTFLALEAADAVFAALSAYFDGCRMKRNDCEYDFAGGVTETDADGLLKTAQKFAVDAEVWIKARYPRLV